MRPEDERKRNYCVFKIRTKIKIFIDKIDTYDGTPIIDIRIFSEELDCPKI